MPRQRVTWTACADNFRRPMKTTVAPVINDPYISYDNYRALNDKEKAIKTNQSETMIETSYVHETLTYDGDDNVFTNVGALVA
jgi:hypothetical protein